MNILIKRIPLRNNESLLNDYWMEHITEWKIETEDIGYFANKAVNNLWVYAAFQDSICCGILVNEEDTLSSLWLFHVLPQYRNKGIGGLLFENALKNVKTKWIAGIGTGYWWQGVPLGYGDQFLEKRGFNWQWTSVDMILSLEEWVKPIVHSKMDIGILEPHENNLLVNMLRDEEDLSGWVEYYEEMIEDANYDNILVARADNMIIGCVMILEEEGH